LTTCTKFAIIGETGLISIEEKRDDLIETETKMDCCGIEHSAQHGWVAALCICRGNEKQ
jgi:hypothetical protein